MSVFVVSQVASAIITVAIDVFNGYWSDLFLGIGPLIVTLLGLFYLRDLYVIRQQHKLDAENNERMLCRSEVLESKF